MMFAPRREQSHFRLPWEGYTAVKPWNYRVFAAIPVMDFHEDVGLIIELLRLQTIRPYIVLIDTGSLPENYLEMEKHRAEDVEVHRLALNGVLHPCDFPSMAMDVAMAVCRSPFMLTTHQDLYFRRRDVIEEMLPLAEKHHACGYHITRQRYHQDIDGMIGHQCSMFDMRALDTIQASWSQRRICTLFGLRDHRPDATRQWFPDTELAVNYLMRDGGIKPYIIGHETFGERQVDDRLDHCRAINTYTLYHPEYAAMAHEWIRLARAEARERIAAWRAEDAARPLPTISVITAVSRPENLPRLDESLDALRQWFSVEWIRIGDTSKVSLPGTHAADNVAGCPQKNLGLEQATGEWVWFLDDDNLCLPPFGEVLRQQIGQHPDSDIFIFDQINADGSLRCVARDDQFSEGYIDQAQYVVRRSAIGSARFPVGSYQGDWHFIRSVAMNAKATFVHNHATGYNLLA